MKKINDEKEQYKQQLEQQNQQKNNIMERTLKAVNTFKQPIRNNGKIYIATSPEYIKQYIYKIGLTTTELSKREKSLQTSCPSIQIVYDVDVKDVDLAESLIHTYLTHLNFEHVCKADIRINAKRLC